jgi:2-oxoglutarate dehydrogenase E1 component
MEDLFVPGFPDYAQLANIGLIEEIYAKYAVDPGSVDPSWRAFFEGIDFAGFLSQRAGGASKDKRCRILELIKAYRRYGYLLAKINPIDPNPLEMPELSLEKLGFSEQELEELFPALGFCEGKEAKLKEIIAALSQIYCSRIGFEIGHLNNPAMEKWLQERIEPKLSIQLTQQEKLSLHEYLSKAEMFETFVHTKYVGQTRFSLEGGETLIPVLAEMIEKGAKLGCSEYYIGMAHRGRLNVLTHILNKPYSMVFQEFEDVLLPLTLEGSGEVKYHRGFSANTVSRSKLPVSLHLAANSSALESVNAVVLGQARANQVLTKDDARKKTAAVLIHGDASIAGQGVIYEAMQFMRLPGYSTGGTLHIVVNNQIGFTTLPEEGRSTRYATDIAKTFECPVFHVNAEDPESCIFAVRLAIEFRLAFQTDVFIDLNCYRKYGHNEGDEPSYTQPIQYKIIRAKQSIRELYRQQLMNEGMSLANNGDEAFKTALNEAFVRGKKEEPHPPEDRFGSTWQGFVQPKAETLFEPFDSSAKEDLLQKVALNSSTVPLEFHLHPKLVKWVQSRQSIAGSIDWGMAETLAFGSLLLQEVPIRLAGQDCRRGTFSQRHAVLVDAENGSLYFPLAHLDPQQARFDVYNSPLSEYACLAFEYGYTWAYRQTLVLWEAQYGDFNNGAQIVIDQYISPAEQKGARYSSLVLLLPHAFEGQGPEHSSGRIERFLQLAASNNIQVVNATTPAQYFHLVRRQALRKIKKPLIVFTPKSLLRQSACTSLLKEFTSGQFEEFLDDPKASKNPKRVLFCSGKVYYDLLLEQEKRKRADIAIVRIEQLYPVHTLKLEAILSKYANCSDFRWVQEEPENMGAWEFIRDYLPKATYVGRARSPVVATGSYRQHKQELEHFMDKAFE